MNHMIYRVIRVAVVGDFVLDIEFDDGLKRTIDLEAILAGELFGPLKDPRQFAQVEIDPETHTVVWPNGADLDPETLHNWPEYEDQMRKMAERWAAAKSGV
jgi:hypothetical protein